MRRLSVLWASIGALALGLSACGGGGDGSTVEAPAETSQSDTTASTTLAQGGEATIASAQGVSQLDPYKILFAFEGVVHPLMWATLTQYTPEGGETVEPNLATEWEASADQKTWTFTLRPDLKTSTGEPLTSDKIAASLERAFDPETAFLWAIFIPKVAAVSAPDESTVEIKLKTPGRYLPAALTKISIMDVDELGKINRSPAVTGPYKVAKFTPDQSLELVPNEHYHGDPPKLDKLIFTKAQDATAAVTSLRAGEVQALWSVPWTDVRELDGNSDVAITTGDKPAQNGLILTDNTSGVFKDVKARQALAHAVDRQSIVDAVYAGRGDVPTTNNPVFQWSDLVTDGLQEYDFDLDKAKELFAEAGVTEGSELTFWAPAGAYPEWTSVGELLQKDLETIGINLKIETNEISQWVEPFAPAGKKFPDMIVPNIYGGMPLPLNLSSWVPGVCECNFDNADYNKALADAQAATDDDAAKAALATAQKVFNEQVPVALTVQTSIPVGHVSDLQGIWIDPSGLSRFDRAGYVE